MNVKYLIVTPKDLKDSLLSLVQQKQRLGYNVVIKEVEDFGGSSPNYILMREYIRSQQPEMLLLVGDYDKTPGYPLTRSWGQGSQVQSYTYYSDVFYTMDDDQVVPDIPTGRLSTNDPNILRNICHTLLAYPNDPCQSWRHRAILTGWTPRGPENPNWKCDAGYQCIEEIGSYFEPIMEFEYVHSHSEIRKTLWGTRDSSEDSLKQAINKGALIIRYLAHGHEYGWANIGGAYNSRDDIQLTDVRNLRLGRYNIGGRTEENWKLPLVISAACLTGRIERRSFAEEWQIYLKAIGVFAADQESSTYWNDRITQRMFHQIVSRQKKRIGDIFISAMKQLYKECDRNDEFDHHTYRMYRYLGDPDTILATPDPKRTTLSETSEHGPALASTDTTLLLGWVGTGNHKLNFLSSNDGINFFNKKTLGETSHCGISLTTFNNKFVIAWTGTGQGNLNVMQSEDGINWTDKTSLNETSESAPAIVALDDKLYLAWRGKGNNKLNIILSEDGLTWNNKRTLDETTNSGPSLVGLDKSTVILGWRGLGNNALNLIQVSEDLSTSNKVTLGESTNARLCLSNQEKQLYCAWRGMDNALNVFQSSDGKSWGKKVTFDEKCTDSPTLKSFGHELVWAWTDMDGHINTLIQDWRL